MLTIPKARVLTLLRKLHTSLPDVAKRRRFVVGRDPVVPQARVVRMVGALAHRAER
jgi:hypothetical protein